MSIRILALVALLLPAWPSTAQGIVNAGVQNRSAADLATARTGADGAYQALEFRSDSTLSRPQFDGRTARLEHHMAWFAGHWTDTGGVVYPPGNVDGFAFNLGRELSFTVLDAAGQGYRLRFENELRGALMATELQGPAEARARLPAIRVALDNGQGIVDVPALGTSHAMLSSGAPLASHLISEYPSNEYDFVPHRRSFTLRSATTEGEVQLSSTAWAGSAAQALVRFGLGPALAQLAGGAYPGPDGEVAALHGRFVRVIVDYPASPVPEPGSALMLGTGWMLVLLLCKHGRAASWSLIACKPPSRRTPGPLPR